MSAFKTEVRVKIGVGVGDEFQVSKFGSGQVSGGRAKDSRQDIGRGQGQGQGHVQGWGSG
ncbi:hypothetical protein TIFTF001_028900 [Ficus carica]|uniref:Uncharacterized protein n=1 Tax=Ficus carica TaxID=3494 RepID=A0AA88J248_FICCA|nr:hypothetical protein TIFTF001_028900 [Ficus carica]